MDALNLSPFPVTKQKAVNFSTNKIQIEVKIAIERYRGLFYEAFERVMIDLVEMIWKKMQLFIYKLTQSGNYYNL